MEEELTKLPFVVSLDGSIVPAGRSFDAMRTKTTVTNARSMGAWTVDKQPGAAKKDAVSGEDAAGGSIAERRRRRREGK